MSINMASEQESRHLQYNQNQQQVESNVGQPQIVTLDDSTDPDQNDGIVQNANNQAYSSSIDIELVKNKVESYDLDNAISDLTNIINKSSEMFYELKKIKFEYLSQAFELYSRIDFPSLMMIKLEQSMSDELPLPRKIEQLSVEAFRNEQTGA